MVEASHNDPSTVRQTILSTVLTTYGKYISCSGSQSKCKGKIGPDPVSGLRVSGFLVSGLRVSGFRVSGLCVSGFRVSGLRVSGFRFTRSVSTKPKHDNLLDSCISYAFSLGFPMSTLRIDAVIKLYLSNGRCTCSELGLVYFYSLE